MWDLSKGKGKAPLMSAKSKVKGNVIMSSDDEEEKPDNNDNDIYIISSDSEDDYFDLTNPTKKAKGKAKGKKAVKLVESGNRDSEFLNAQQTSVALGVQPVMMSKFIPSTKMLWM